jgi:molybdenum cofactor biosynthesis protein MoaC
MQEPTLPSAGFTPKRDSKFEYTFIPQPRFHASRVGTPRPSRRPGDSTSLNTARHPGHSSISSLSNVHNRIEQVCKTSSPLPLKQKNGEIKPDHWAILTDPEAFTVPTSRPRTLNQWQWQVSHLQNRVNTIFATVARHILPESRKEIWRICKGLTPQELQELKGTEKKMTVRQIEVETAVANAVQRRNKILEITGKDQAMTLSWSELKAEEKRAENPAPKTIQGPSRFLDKSASMEREYEDPFHISKMLLKRAPKERMEKLHKGIRRGTNVLNDLEPSLAKWRRELWAVAHTIHKRCNARRNGLRLNEDDNLTFEEAFKRVRSSNISMQRVGRAVRAAKHANRLYLNSPESGREERAALKKMEDSQINEKRRGQKFMAAWKAVNSLLLRKIPDWRRELSVLKEQATGVPLPRGTDMEGDELGITQQKLPDAPVLTGAMHIRFRPSYSEQLDADSLLPLEGVQGGLDGMRDWGAKREIFAIEKRKNSEERDRKIKDVIRRKQIENEAYDELNAFGLSPETLGWEGSQSVTHPLANVLEKCDSTVASPTGRKHQMSQKRIEPELERNFGPGDELKVDHGEPQVPARLEKMARVFEGTERRMAPFSRSSFDADEPTTQFSTTLPEDEAQQQTRNQLTHLTPSGSAHMVNISPKTSTHRLAIAIGTVSFSNPATLNLVRSAALKKGDVLSVARIAGIQAAKFCPMIIPLCHPIAISGVEVEISVLDSVPASSETGEQTQSHTRQEDKGSFQPHPSPKVSSQSLASNATILQHGGIHIAVRVECVGPTGVEMEALTAVMGACLTVVDMVKAVDRGATIGDVRVVRKMGGRSGEWVDESYTGK